MRVFLFLISFVTSRMFRPPWVGMGSLVLFLGASWRSEWSRPGLSRLGVSKFRGLCLNINTKWYRGHKIARGWATLLLDRLRDFVVVPSSAGGKSSFELLSQISEHRKACHFGPLSPLPWPLGHVRLISFLGLVCDALLFFSTCYFSNSGPSGPVSKIFEAS